MRWQTTLVLAIFLAILGGFYYVYEVRMGPGREEAAARKGRVFAADTKDVTELEIKRGAETVRLQREGDDWRLVEPLKARGSRSAVDETLANVLTAKIDREIDANPKTPADFGLDTLAADVTLTLKDGRKLGLELGAKNPTGVWVYARERGKPAVFVIGESVLRDATRPLAEFRDRALLAFNAREVSGFEIVLPEETLAVEGSTGSWRLTKPAAMRADNETIAEFLDKLAAVQVTDFVAEAPASLDTYGLARPARVTIHTGRDKDRVSRTVLLGRDDPAKKGVYAMRPGETSVMLVPETAAKVVPRNVAVLRNKVLVTLDPEKVMKLEVESAKGVVTVARDKEQWKIVAPQPAAADQTEVGAIINRLRELRALGFLSDDASSVPRYLTKPDVRVTLTEDGGAATTVLLAASRETRGGTPSAYAAIAGKGPVVLVDGKAVDNFTRSLTDLRDRRLLGAIEPRDVKRVRVRAGGQTVVLERSGEAEWKMLEPTKGKAQTAKIDDLLFAIRTLRWKDIAAADGGDAAKYGLDAPAMEVVLFKGDGSEIATVQVGKREGEVTYVRTKAQPTVYSVEGRVLGPAPKLPDDFKA